MTMSRSAIFRLLLGLIGAFAIWLRWMYVFVGAPTPLGRLMTRIHDAVGKRPLFVVAVAATGGSALDGVGGSS